MWFCGGPGPVVLHGGRVGTLMTPDLLPFTYTWVRTCDLPPTRPTVSNISSGGGGRRREDSPSCVYHRGRSALTQLVTTSSCTRVPSFSVSGLVIHQGVKGGSVSVNMYPESTVTPWWVSMSQYTPSLTWLRYSVPTLLPRPFPKREDPL